METKQYYQGRANVKNISFQSTIKAKEKKNSKKFEVINKHSKEVYKNFYDEQKKVREKEKE